LFAEGDNREIQLARRVNRAGAFR